MCETGWSAEGCRLGLGTMATLKAPPHGLRWLQRSARNQMGVVRVAPDTERAGSIREKSSCPSGRQLRSLLGLRHEEQSSPRKLTAFCDDYCPRIVDAHRSSYYGPKIRRHEVVQISPLSTCINRWVRLGTGIQRTDDLPDFIDCIAKPSVYPGGTPRSWICPVCHKKPWVCPLLS